jgi:HD-GYP domain-containing protein (c-di-GMP phosphodiesterase class II)
MVDVYDALTTTRPYRTAWSSERAQEELIAEAGNGAMRQDLVEALVSLVGSRPDRSTNA